MAAVTEVSRLHECQFSRWIGPLSPADFRGKRVLDAGCGMGRNSYFALRYGATEVVTFDYDHRTIATAKATLADFPNARVEFRNVYEIEYTDEFDVAMCIGVVDISSSRSAPSQISSGRSNQGERCWLGSTATITRSCDARECASHNHVACAAARPVVPQLWVEHPCLRRAAAFRRQFRLFPAACRERSPAYTRHRLRSTAAGHLALF